MPLTSQLALLGLLLVDTLGEDGGVFILQHNGISSCPPPNKDSNVDIRQRLLRPRLGDA